MRKHEQETCCVLVILLFAIIIISFGIIGFINKPPEERVLMDRSAGLSVVPKSSTSLLVSWQLDSNVKRSSMKEIVVNYCCYQSGNKRCDALVIQEVSDAVLIRNLQPFTTYEVYVTFRTKLGEVDFSNTIMVNTLETAPSDPPKIIRHSVDPAENTIQVEWNPPETPNGIITHYVVHVNDKRQRVEAETGETKTTIYDHLIESLQYHTNYKIAVQACVLGQCSGKSKSINVLSAPGAPGDTPEIIQHSVDADANSIILDWNPPSQPNGIISHYFVYLNGEKRRVEAEYTKDVIFKGLEYYTVYAISIQACVLKKCSKRSDPIKVTSAIGWPGDNPEIQEYYVDQLDNSLRVEWSLPKKANGPISHFFVHMNKDRIRLRADDGQTKQRSYTHIFRKLQYSSEYTVSVQVCVEENKCSKFSNQIKVWSATAWPMEKIALYSVYTIIAILMALILIKASRYNIFIVPAAFDYQGFLSILMRRRDETPQIRYSAVQHQSYAKQQYGQERLWRTDQFQHQGVQDPLRPGHQDKFNFDNLRGVFGHCGENTFPHRNPTPGRNQDVIRLPSTDDSIFSFLRRKKNFISSTMINCIKNGGLAKIPALRKSFRAIVDLYKNTEDQDSETSDHNGVANDSNITHDQNVPGSRLNHRKTNLQDGLPGPSRPYAEDGRPGPSKPYARDSRPGPSKPYARDSRPGPSKPYARDSRPGPSKPYARDSRPGPSKPYARDGMLGPSKPYVQDSRPGPSKPFEKSRRPDCVQDSQPGPSKPYEKNSRLGHVQDGRPDPSKPYGKNSLSGSQINIQNPNRLTTSEDTSDSEIDLNGIADDPITSLVVDTTRYDLMPAEIQPMQLRRSSRNTELGKESPGKIKGNYCFENKQESCFVREEIVPVEQNNGRQAKTFAGNGKTKFEKEKCFKSEAKEGKMDGNLGQEKDEWELVEYSEDEEQALKDDSQQFAAGSKKTFFGRNISDKSEGLSKKSINEKDIEENGKAESKSKPDLGSEKTKNLDPENDGFSLVCDWSSVKKL